MKKRCFIFIIFLILINFLFVSFSNASSSNGIDVNLNVITCNNNAICQLGENFLTCPSDCPVPPPTPTSNTTPGGYLMDGKDFFRNLTVIPSYTSATIKWNSAFPTIYIIKWGTTEDYKNGTLKNIHFVYDHSVDISGLEPSTLYYFTIESESYTGVKASINNQTFTTLTPVDNVAPANVTNVKISTTISGVVLSWVNPKDKDFSYVRIVRSTSKYISDPLEGKLVYEGGGQYMRDTNVKSGEKYFYTIFARDKNGNFSSGYPISIIHNPPTDGVIKIYEEIPSIITLTPLENLDYFVIQNGIKKDLKYGGTVEIDGSILSKVSVVFKKENNDEMWIEIRDSLKKVTGRYFFNKYNNQLSDREVTIPTFEKGGYYSLSVFRYVGSTEQLIHQAGLDVKMIEKNEGRKVFSFCIIWWIILLIILMIIIYIISRRKKRKKDELKEKENI